MTGLVAHGDPMIVGLQPPDLEHVFHAVELEPDRRVGAVRPACRNLTVFYNAPTVSIDAQVGV